MTVRERVVGEMNFIIEIKPNLGIKNIDKNTLQITLINIDNVLVFLIKYIISLQGLVSKLDKIFLLLVELLII